MAMKDDTKGEDDGSSNFEFSSKINAILEHRIHRKSAARWARNLRFLTFDNDEDSANIEPMSRLGREQCTRCELRVPPPAGHICAAHLLLKKHSKAREKRLKEYADPCLHVQDASCEDCSHIPLFPNRGKITRFRIRRLKPKDTKPSKFSRCCHFVAVSYCWSSQSARKSAEDETDDEQYQILEEDRETIRQARAPKDTIDRAVKFAAENGFRMIWIDQVMCFPMMWQNSVRLPDTKSRNASSKITSMKKSLLSKRWTMCMLGQICQLDYFKRHFNSVI